MSNFFNEFSDKSSCRNSGMCSIDPSSYALEELLLNEIKQIAFYIVKLSDFKDQFPLCGKNMQSDKPDDEIKIMQDAIRALSVIIVNTAFRLDDYTKLIYGLEEQKQIIKTKYVRTEQNSSRTRFLCTNVFIEYSRRFEKGSQ